jgi:CBS domain-containing protein
MDNLSSRFLSAYNDIDSHLRLICNLEDGMWFPEVVDRAADKIANVRSLKNELKDYGRLRNAIVHNYRDEETIATPHERVVKRIETVRDYLRKPPIIGQLFKTTVAICDLDTAVLKAAKVMLRDGFSQLPVYRGDEFQALLTTNTIARWLAACFERDQGVVDDMCVEVVLGYAEEGDNYVFLKPGHTVADAIEQFASTERVGRRLDAILITQDGTKNRRPSGIITPADIPRLYEAIP